MSNKGYGEAPHGREVSQDIYVSPFDIYPELAAIFAETNPVEQENCRPDVAMLCYTPRKLVRYRILDLLALNDPEPDQALARQYSPCFQVSEDTPSFLYDLQPDPVVPIKHSFDYVNACEKYDVPFEIHISMIMENTEPAFYDSKLLINWREPLTNWLAAQDFLE